MRPYGLVERASVQASHVVYFLRFAEEYAEAVEAVAVAVKTAVQTR